MFPIAMYAIKRARHPNLLKLVLGLGKLNESYRGSVLDRPERQSGDPAPDVRQCGRHCFTEGEKSYMRIFERDLQKFDLPV